MGVPEKSVLQPMLRTPQKNYRRHSWSVLGKDIVLHGFAIIGFAWFASRFWQYAYRVCPSGHSRVPNVALDIYPDTDYPLRPALEPWDISKSYPYPRKLSKNVTEGTWLRIAVHPFKDEIVFDMLGDLYCMSTSEITTGEESHTAYPFLTGVPFEKEAEFSNDGSQIVFISDSGFGVDNVWTMPYSSCMEMSQTSTAALRNTMVQQTNATFRFYSSPAFHPTESRLIATKWFLTGRPNGAGEIWEIPVQQKPANHLPEISGKRLVARKLPASWKPEQYFESQLGAEQARYAPGGDTVIFSRNVKDDAGGKFSYNKDVHAGINAVFAFNITSGETVELVAAAANAPNKAASPGGANMPRLSRDGQTLAFIRRVDDNEVLALKDMRSGTVHYIWDGLTFDLSMIPTFMGAYPNYGWSANDDSIIIWSEGQIYKLDIEFNHLKERVGKGGPRRLPFTAEISLSLGETRYSKQNIHESELSSELQIRSFESLRADYAGENVIFQAAGDNYRLELVSQKVIRLPKPEDSISCYAPSFVMGTPYELQACWHDRNLTSFVLVNSEEKSVYNIEGLPKGKYISPVIQNGLIAYVRTGKDYMLGDVEETYGEGVWIGNIVLPTKGTEAKVSGLRLLKSLKSSSDTKLDFRTSGRRTLLMVQNPSSVVEYDVEDDSQRVLSTGKTSVEMTALEQKNGNGLILAFRDFQHVWLASHAPDPTLGVWSKPGDSPRGLIRLSEFGGHDVVVSQNGQRVLWFFGPSIHYADVSAIEASCFGASLQARDSSECALPLVTRQELNISHKTSLGYQIGLTGGQPFVLVNATLVSMASESPVTLLNATIVTKNGQIVAVGEGTTINIPTDAEVWDVSGGAVLPGYVDVHGHWGNFWSPYPLTSWEMETFLGYGVTTIHNPASKNVAGMTERNLVEKGRMYGPRIFHTGDVLYGSTQPPVYTEINSLADAHAALLRVKVEGGNSSFSVKNYQLVARSARQRLLSEAKGLDMLVVPEGGWSLDWDLTYFIDGYTSLEHPVPVPSLYDDVLSLIAASGSSYTPLAVMNYGGIFGQHFIHQNEYIPGDKKLRKYVKHDILESLAEVKKAPRSSYQFLNTTKSTAELAKRGVRTNVGAHGEQPIGYLYHSEMYMMAMGGQTSYEVLRHATIGGATSLGLDRSIGTIEAGKLADLVVYPPGVDTIESVWDTSMHMQYVMRGGTLFAVEDGLVEVWPRNGRRQTMPRINPKD